MPSTAGALRWRPGLGRASQTLRSPFHTLGKNYPSNVPHFTRISATKMPIPSVGDQSYDGPLVTTADDSISKLFTKTLSPEECQSLTQLQVGNIYELGIVDSPADLAAGLETDLAAGLDPTLKEALAARAELYGRNSVPSPPSASFLELLLEALDDFTVKVLLGAGSASLGLEFWLAQQDGSKPNWIEGVSILAAVAVVTLVTAGNNYQKEKQFKALQEVQAEETVRRDNLKEKRVSR